MTNKRVPQIAKKWRRRRLELHLETVVVGPKS